MSLLTIFYTPFARARLAAAAGLGAVLFFGSWSLGCGGTGIPDPQDAVDEYARAAQQGDADAIYDMMSDKSQQALSREDLHRIVENEKAELSQQAKALQADGVTVKAEAKVRYSDGEHASLDYESGAFRIASADALPAGARTPTQALEQLRRVLARRSYAGLMRVLSPATRAAIENDLRSLVEGLERPEGLNVHVSGDTAVVEVPGGHQVRLRRDNGVWQVEDFD